MNVWFSFESFNWGECHNQCFALDAERDDLPTHVTPAKHFIDCHKAFLADIRAHTHTDSNLKECTHCQITLNGRDVRNVSTYTHCFFLSKAHLAHHDRLICNEVFITESQVFNMSHISQPVPAKRPLASKLHWPSRTGRRERPSIRRERERERVKIQKMYH